MLTNEQRLRMLEVPTGLVDVVIDTDAYNEIDDQFAISQRAGDLQTPGAAADGTPGVCWLPAVSAG